MHAVPTTRGPALVLPAPDGSRQCIYNDAPHMKNAHETHHRSPHSPTPQPVNWSGKNSSPASRYLHQSPRPNPHGRSCTRHEHRHQYGRPQQSQAADRKTFPWHPATTIGPTALVGFPATRSGMSRHIQDLTETVSLLLFQTFLAHAITIHTRIIDQWTKMLFVFGT